MADIGTLPEHTRLYHNPRCAKSRQTLAMPEENVPQPEVVMYPETPPTTDEQAVPVEILGGSVRNIIRVKESEYKELDLDTPSLSDPQLLQAFSAHPKLIERPVVTHRGKAAPGRPPEKVLALIRGNDPTTTP